MAKTFFTADTHLGHANIIKYCNRPFAGVKEMDEALIANWNAVVKPEDVVYHLGDFCFGKKFDDFHRYFSQLNGSIIFLKGNHDSLAWKNRHAFAESYDAYLEEKINSQDITLCHYAMRVWNKCHYGAWHLYGHSHGTLPDDPNSLSLDIGVDCHGFKPVSFAELKALMAKKTFKPIDHHGKKD